MHELLAPYALHALDPDEEREVERHLARCERCRIELGALQEAAVELAYTVVAPAPPPELYSRIEARLRPTNVVHLRRTTVLKAAAVVAVAAVVALGFRVGSLSQTLDRERQAHRADARLAAVLSTPGTRTYALDRGHGSLVVSPSRDAALLVSGIERAAPGHVYEAWILADSAPEPAGVFEGGPGGSSLALTRPLPRGATVAVTMQVRGDLDTPTLPILFGARET
jgi:anti-sigma factor RsiW